MIGEQRALAGRRIRRKPAGTDDCPIKAARHQMFLCLIFGRDHVARIRKSFTSPCPTKVMSISVPNSTNGKPSTASTDRTAPSMEKRLTRLSEKSYNPKTQASRKFVDLTFPSTQRVRPSRTSATTITGPCPPLSPPLMIVLRGPSPRSCFSPLQLWWWGSRVCLQFCRLSGVKLASANFKSAW